MRLQPNQENQTQKHLEKKKKKKKGLKRDLYKPKLLAYADTFHQI